MSERTLNGHEITNPVAPLSAEGFRRRMAEEYGFFEGSAEDRAKRLKEMSVEGVAILLEDINKSVQGSRDSLIDHENMTPIGGKQPTLSPEDRYGVFLDLVESIRACPDEVNPARIGDVLALGVVMLHPFYDGSGRTARVLGLMFRDGYDAPDYKGDYDIATEGRDKARERGGYMIFGYVPQMPEGMDQSKPEDVKQYLKQLLTTESPDAYVSCYGQAPLLKAEK